MVGQEHVVRTLSNAIDQDKVHHAYLFVGSRGTGKTSMAKILAASLNCRGEGGGGSGPGGPTTTPCGACDSCRGIANAASLDVIEMDAASNNSVDDIRELRERVAYAPVSGGHKVYILDEAHMLTAAAWNAFLKTLEEPPPNTVFVLATTEANKVLPTVVDRCHRFDFARPSVGQIAQVLRRVAEFEQIGIPEEATALVARSATGSFRDALGSLEQLVAYSGQSITLDDVLAVLGAADADLVFGAIDAVASGSAREGLLVAARIAESGRDFERFFRDLEGHARALLLVSTLGGKVPPELRLTADHDARLAAQATRVPVTEVIRLLDLISAGLRAMKDGSDARTQLELALVKAAAPEHDASTKALLARIERLEARLAGDVPATPPKQPDQPVTAAGRAAAAAAAAGERESSRTANGAASRGADSHGEYTEARGGSATAVPPSANRLVDDPSGREIPSESAALRAPARDHPGGVSGLPMPAREDPGASPAPRGRVSDVNRAIPTDGGADNPPVDAVPDDAATARSNAGPAGPDPSVLDLTSFREIWPAVVQSLQNDHPMIAALLQEARPANCDGRLVTLTWAESHAFFKRKVEDPVNRDRVLTAIQSVTGTSVRLACELCDDADEEQLATSEPALSEDELIARFMSEFDAQELPPESSKES